MNNWFLVWGGRQSTMSQWNEGPCLGMHVAIDETFGDISGKAIAKGKMYVRLGCYLCRPFMKENHLA